MTADEDYLLRRTRLAVGIDLDLSALKAHKGLNAKIYGNLTQIPLRDESFELITANMVVEHLDQPEAVFRQVHRLLKPDGQFVFHTTNGQNPVLRFAKTIPQGLKNRIIHLLEHRKPEDVFPTHYLANQPDQITALAEATGFEISALDHVSTSATLQMLTPVVVCELFFIRLLRRERFQHLRTNIVCVLRKKPRT
jgi:ubiquinone/menaquinone biosynthesis C-methylase UbiE